jgi:hypothetical protein
MILLKGYTIVPAWIFSREIAKTTYISIYYDARPTLPGYSAQHPGSLDRRQL